jgi:hypothetical protein
MLSRCSAISDELMTQAKAMTVRIPAMRTVIRDYTIDYIDGKLSHWLAEQTLELRGAQGDAFLALVAELPSRDVALGALGRQACDETLKKLADTPRSLHSNR